MRRVFFFLFSLPQTHNREQSDEEAFPFITKVKQDQRVPYWTTDEGNKFGTTTSRNSNGNIKINNNQSSSSAGASSSSITNQSAESSSPSTIIFEAVDIGNHVAYEAAIIYDSLLVLLSTAQALNYQYAPLLLLLTPEQLVPSHHNHNEDPLGRKVGGGANAQDRQHAKVYGDQQAESGASGGQAKNRPKNDRVSCKSEKPWVYGPTFYNYLNAVQVEGMTGQLSFKVLSTPSSVRSLPIWFGYSSTYIEILQSNSHEILVNWVSERGDNLGS